MSETSILPLVIKPGKIVAVPLRYSQGATELDIQDNFDDMQTPPSLFGSLDNGQTYEALSSKFMQKLAAGTVDMILRIDTTQCMHGVDYIVKNIIGYNADSSVAFDAEFDAIFDDVDITVTDSKPDDDHFYYDSAQRVYDEADLKKVVQDNLHELTNAAQDSAAWQIKYYRADALRNIDTLNAEELKSITTCKDVAVFFPHRKTIGQLDFDQFGLSYEELTNMHIAVDEFHRVYEDSFARPNRNDIVYIGFLDQFFEITDVQDVKSPINSILYYDCTMRFLSDRQSVAKQDDILNIGDLVNGSVQSNAYELKQPAKPEHKQFAKIRWSNQEFADTEQTAFAVDSKPTYGICNLDGWKKFKIANKVLYLINITATDFESGDIVPLDTEQSAKLWCAKYAQFNEELSEFNANVYFTAPKLPRTLQPLKLLELQQYE